MESLKVFIDPFRGLPKPVWYLAAMTFVNRSGTMVMPFLSLYITQALGFSLSFAGTILGLYGLGALVGTSIGGPMTDRLGPVTVLKISFTLTGLMFFAVEMLTQPATVAAGMFTLGLFSELHRPAGSTAIAEYCPADRRVRAYGLYRLAVNAGATLGPSIGGLIVLFGYEYLFRIDGLTCLLAALVLSLLPLPKTPHHPSRQSMPAAKSPWRDGRFMLFILIISLNGIIFFQVFSTLPIFLKNEYGFKESSIGLLMGMNGLLIIMFEMMLVHRLERRNPLSVIKAGILFTALGFGILPLYQGMLFAAFSVFLWTVGEMLTSPMMSSFVANRASDHNRGRYMGILNMGFSVAFIVGPTVGTWVYDRLGSDVLWLAIGTLGLLLFLSMNLLQGAESNNRAS